MEHPLSQFKLRINVPSGSIFNLEIEYDGTGYTFDMPLCDEQDEHFIQDTVAGFFTPAQIEPVSIQLELANFKHIHFPGLAEEPIDQIVPSTSGLLKFSEFIVALIAPRALRDGLLGDTLERHTQDIEKFGERKAKALLWFDFLCTILSLLKSRLVGLISLVVLVQKLWRLF
jgi:hypothetical protein